MIYKIYINVAGWTNLDLCYNKEETIELIKTDNKRKKHTYYMILEEEKGKAPNWDILRNQEEIDNYINEYEETKKLKDMSCVELKKQILDMQDKQKVKTKGSRKNDVNPIWEISSKNSSRLKREKLFFSFCVIFSLFLNF